MTPSLIFSIVWETVKGFLFAKETYYIIGVLVVLKMLNKKFKLKKGRFIK